MPDPRVTKLAKVMVHYSLEIKPGQQLQIRTHPLAGELTLAVYEEAIQAGANVFINNAVPGTRRSSSSTPPTPSWTTSHRSEN